eukprot:2781046-Rhodomonas_salina.1
MLSSFLSLPVGYWYLGVPITLSYQMALFSSHSDQQICSQDTAAVNIGGCAPISSSVAAINGGSDTVNSSSDRANRGGQLSWEGKGLIRGSGGGSRVSGLGSRIEGPRSRSKELGYRVRQWQGAPGRHLAPAYASSVPHNA